MVNRQELKGQWNEVKGRLKEHWGQLTEDDLQRAEGSADQLVGVVQQKTGATRREVESFLNNVLDGSFGDRAAESVHQYAEAAQAAATDAAAYARENYRRLASQSGEYTTKVAATVRSRPAESLAIAFGLGIAAGALFFMGNKK
ncbi:CsbD family protein [Stieleria sp. ICT_E10.1]|uniref:CsbD family protein n=1 Tax=Stieleria sedimenti TaxID=2976331 RepID=UPI00217F7987|nr:CsbD family protein [Stieleria sedimenti]MCS7465494.1 CsbD family protein [Stieleria sedimenti]